MWKDKKLLWILRDMRTSRSFLPDYAFSDENILVWNTKKGQNMLKFTLSTYLSTKSAVFYSCTVPNITSNNTDITEDFETDDKRLNKL